MWPEQGRELAERHSRPRAGSSSTSRRRQRRELGVLGWASPLALLGEDLPVEEELTTPDAPRLAPLDGAGKARLLHRAQLADLLCPADVVDLLGEEQRRHGRCAVLAAG